MRAGPAEGGGREQHIAQFSTTVRGLLALHDWLVAHRVQQVTEAALAIHANNNYLAAQYQRQHPVSSGNRGWAACGGIHGAGYAVPSLRVDPRAEL